MFETIREFGAERLAESGEEEGIRREHTVYFLGLAETAEPELRGPRQVEWLSRLESEHGNLRAAMSWAIERGEAEIGVRIAARCGGLARSAAISPRDVNGSRRRWRCRGPAFRRNAGQGAERAATWRITRPTTPPRRPCTSRAWRSIASLAIRGVSPPRSTTSG